MKETKNRAGRDIIVVGFALFSMFFGAGNVIFPPYLGMESGPAWLAGFSAYFIADIGLALAAMFALLRVGSSEAVLQRVGRVPAEILMCAIILCVGPMVAIPRTSASTFEMAIAPNLPGVSAVVFSVLFFALILALCIRESAVVDIVGKVLTPLQEVYGVDVSDDALRKAVAEHNEVCRILTEIGQFRKEENPRITGYEYHILNLVSYCCPKYLIVDKLRETLEELRQREPDVKPRFRVKIAVVGSEIDDPSLTKLIEGCGALVVSDRFCFGSTPGREVIELNDEEDVLRQICRHYMKTSECARYISDEKVHQRRETADRLAREYNADGIIYEQMKYCDYWGFERALASYVLNTEYGWPVLSIDRVYNNGYSGQLRTRVQAFVESLEIKKIQRERGAK